MSYFRERCMPGLNFAIYFYFVVYALLADEPRMVVTVGIAVLIGMFRPHDLAAAIVKTFPLLCIFTLSAVTTVASGQVPFDIVKGTWYLLRPVIYLVAGYLICVQVNDTKTLVKLLLLAAAIASLKYLFTYLSDPNVSSETRTYVRRMIGKGDPLMALALTFTAVSIWWGRAIFGVTRVAAAGVAVVALGATVASESRSFLIIAIICLPVVMRVVPRSLFAFVVVPILVGLEILVTTPLLSYMFGRSEVASFAAGAPTFVNEMLSMDRQSEQDINDFWRGFETFYAFRYVFDQGGLASLFGTGLGSQVPVPIAIKLGDETFTSLPIFHNGFSLIVVRAGWIGLCLYILQNVLIARDVARLSLKGSGRAERAFGGICIGCVIVVCLTTPTIAGLYNYQGTLTLMVGIGIGMASLRRRVWKPKVILAPFMHVRPVKRFGRDGS